MPAGTAVGLAATLALSAVAFDGQAWRFLGVLRGQQNLVGTDSFPHELARLFGLERVVPVTAIAHAALAVTAIALLVAVRRRADWLAASGWLLLVLVVATSFPLPWYTIWALPLAAISADRRLLAATLFIQALLVRPPARPVADVVMTGLSRRTTDVLLVGVGLLLALAVAVDVGRRIALDWRMRVDRHAMRVYLHPQVVDPLMKISVRGPHEVVCVTTRDRLGHERVCVRVAHPSTNAWRIVDASRTPASPVNRSAPAPAEAAPGRAGRRVRGAPDREAPLAVAAREEGGRAQREATSPLSLNVPTDGTNR